jgi:hypothetical protein
VTEPALSDRLRREARATPRGPDDLLSHLLAGLRVLGRPPGDAETLRWLVRQRRAGGGQFWQRFTQAVDRLTPRQREGLSLRHAPAVVHLANPSIPIPSRDEMARDVQALTDQRRHARADAPDEARPLTPGALAGEGAKAITWGDLLVLRTVAVSLVSGDGGAHVRTLLEQAEADRADEGSEHGGLLWWPDSGSVREGVGLRDLRFVAYPPTQREHDLKYIPSLSLLRDLPLALAHYHFHAQSHDEADQAGPGGGDLRAAARGRFTGLVFTFVGPSQLNADYYQPNGVTVDLGTFGP